MKKVVFIVKGNGNAAKKVKALLQKNSSQFGHIHFEILVTQYPKHAITLAQNAAQHFNFIIACGGDGTLHEVINGILKDSTEIKSLPIVGLYPMGSANDFALSQKITSNFNKLLHNIQNNHYYPIDIGKCSFVSSTGNPQISYFINIAEIGFGAHVVQKINNRKHLINPKLSFLMAITSSLFSYRKETVTVKTNNFIYQGKLLLASAANGSCFGGGIYIAPNASINDKLLNFTIIGDITIWDYFKNIFKLKRKQKITHKQVTYLTGNYLTISSVTKIGVEADGEFQGYLPATFSLLKEQINFINHKEPL